LFVGPHPHYAIDLLRPDKIAPTLALDDTPVFEPLKPAYDHASGHPHVGGDLGDGEGLSLNVANSDAQADELRFYPGAERLVHWHVVAAQSAHDIDQQAAHHQPLLGPGYAFRVLKHHGPR